MFKQADDARIALRAAQNSQYDLRNAAREAGHFLHKRDGQWEPEIIHRMRGKPRYTDDRVNPIINQICGELEDSEFTLRVRPNGGDATIPTSKLYDGIIRSIRNLSDADAHMMHAGRKMTEGGFGAVLVSHDYYDSDCFDQDLMVEPIYDAVDRVYLDPDDLSCDGRDAKWGMVLHYLGKEEYEEAFPEGSGKSIGTRQALAAYYYKNDFITIGHLYYLVEEDDLLYKMSDGKVLKASQLDEAKLEALEAQGITIEDTRETKTKVCKFRMLDGGGWLSEPEDTVFDSVPIIPLYGNFSVSEGKLIYRGAVEKLMDMQRVHNYSISRFVEEVALAPRKKIFMTPEQAEGHTESIRTMNTNMEPVQFYNPVGNVPPPYEGGASSPNAALQILVEQSDQAVNRAAGMFAANMGENTHLQSGVAIEKQIDRGNNGTSIYYKGMEAAYLRLGRILVKAIPRVYDATRQLRILKENGDVETAIINQIVPLPGGGATTINDLTVGKYDVVCDVGAKYKNRQLESSEMFLRAMEKDPTLIQTAGDIWTQNIAAPGFDKISERLRAIALGQGLIPPEQMTDEEKQAMANAPQDKGPSAEEMQMQIALLQAQTAQMAEQNTATEHQIKMQELQVKYAGDQQKLQSKLAVDSAKIDQVQQRIDIEASNARAEQMFRMMELQNEKLSTLADALNSIKSAIGAEVILDQSAVGAYKQVAKDINSL